jgi:hypothetical protein
MIAALGILGSPGSAIAQGNPNPGVLPVNAKPFGMTYAEWSAAWWQWALAIDGDEHPIEDPDGGFASNGQGGKVWFLAGSSATAEGALVTRHVTIPAGNAIFFPILNNVWVTLPYPYPGAPDGDPPFTEPGAEEFARSVIAVNPNAEMLSVEVDGRPLENLTYHRVLSPVFSALLPEFNWLDVLIEFFDLGFDVTEGLYSDCVSDGYWIMLAPLSRGEHTIHLRGEIPGAFVTEVLYHVTIE